MIKAGIPLDVPVLPETLTLCVSSLHDGLSMDSVEKAFV